MSALPSWAFYCLMSGLISIALQVFVFSQWRAGTDQPAEFRPNAALSSIVAALDESGEIQEGNTQPTDGIGADQINASANDFHNINDPEPVSLRASSVTSPTATTTTRESSA